MPKQPSTLGERITELRTARGLSVRALAQITRLSPSTICDIERDTTRKPSARTIQTIAQALDVTAQFLQDTNTPGADASALAAVGSLYVQMPPAMREMWLRHGRDMFNFWLATSKRAGR